MAIKIPGGRGGLINQQQKGDPSPNPNGRPRKVVKELKEIGYSLDDIRATMKNMLGLYKEELKEITQDENSTILEIMVASAIIKSVKKGELVTLEILLNRTFGKSAENLNINDHNKKPQKIILSLDPIEAAKQYKEIMQDD